MGELVEVDGGRDGDGGLEGASESGRMTGVPLGSALPPRRWWATLESVPRLAISLTSRYWKRFFVFKVLTFSFGDRKLAIGCTVT